MGTPGGGGVRWGVGKSSWSPGRGGTGRGPVGGQTKREATTGLQKYESNKKMTLFTAIPL